MPDTGRDLVRKHFEQMFNERDLSVCDEIHADEYVEHAIAPFGHDEPGRVHGPSHMRGVVEWLTAQFPDLRMTVEAVAEEGETIAVRVLSEGTNLGPLNGVVPPTGKRFSAHQTHWFRMEDGKLAEHWATRDDLRAMIQIGVVRPPGPPSS